MELIQALEQLSLEVRNQNLNISTDNVGGAHNHLQQLYQSQQYSNVHHQANGGQCLLDNSHRVRQLQEFDNSIETLLAQITDLDSLEFKQTTNQQQPLPNCAHNRRERFSHASFKAHHSGSMETSQEEDSDCSSQQSGCTIGLKKDKCVYPLVKDLLKRDLCAITDTVRKISRILAIGSEIETTYNSLSNRLKQHGESMSPVVSLQDFDVSYIKALCNEFTQLCCTEQHIRNLPTIISYNEYCCKLLTQLKKLNPDFISALMNEAQQYNNEEIFLRCVSPKQIQVGDNSDLLEVDGVAEEELDADVAFLNCDQEHVDNWTENKLYIDNPST